MASAVARGSGWYITAVRVSTGVSAAKAAAPSWIHRERGQSSRAISPEKATTASAARPSSTCTARCEWINAATAKKSGGVCQTLVSFVDGSRWWRRMTSL